MAKRTETEKIEFKEKIKAIDIQYKVLYGVAVHSAKIIARTNRRLYDEFIGAGFTAEQSMELVINTQIRAGLEDSL
jgi:ribosome biogenesis protein Nip4